MFKHQVYKCAKKLYKGNGTFIWFFLASAVSFHYDYFFFFLCIFLRSAFCFASNVSLKIARAMNMYDKKRNAWHIIIMYSMYFHRSIKLVEMTGSTISMAQMYIDNSSVKNATNQVSIVINMLFERQYRFNVSTAKLMVMHRPMFRSTV